MAVQLCRRTLHKQLAGMPSPARLDGYSDPPTHCSVVQVRRSSAIQRCLPTWYCGGVSMAGTLRLSSRDVWNRLSYFHTS